MSLCLGTFAAGAAHAEPIGYPSGGSTATAVMLSATADGPVTGYFVGGNASDDDAVALLDLRTGVQSAFLLDNHGTSLGSIASFGNVSAGDPLEFILFNKQENDMLYSGANNADGVAHAYVTPFSGGAIGSFTYPAGLYVGFEDLLKSQASDYDYNDESFVFTNVTSSAISPTTPASPLASAPEPASLALLGTGALGTVALLRRRTRTS